MTDLATAPPSVDRAAGRGRLLGRAAAGAERHVERGGPAKVPGETSAPTTAEPGPSRLSARLSFIGLTVLYLSVGLGLSYGFGLVSGDALSRVASARFVLFSQDPHLAAMGFVFTPLTTVLQLPIVAVLNPWPGLLSHAVPAITMSALCMAAAATQLLGLLRDRGSTAAWAYSLTAAFALHPLILIYGGNGMSEAPFLLFTIVSARFLLRWLASDDVHDLAVVGLALALAYLVRYDALATAAAVGGLVAVISFRRGRARVASHRFAAAMDASIVVSPIAAAFALWSGVSWLLTGEAFAQFSSVYGNAEILKVSGQADLPVADRVLFSVTESLVLEPLLLCLVASALLVAAVRKDGAALALGAVFGSVLAFQAFTYATGGTFPFLRFSIVVVPLAVGLTAVHRPRHGRMSSRRAGPAAALLGQVWRLSGSYRWLTGVAAGLALVPSFATAWLAMTAPQLAPQEYAVVAGLTPSLVDPKTRLLADQQALTFSTERDVAAYLDSLDLPQGSVLTDTVSSFAVVTASTRPRQFVIPSDADFLPVLNDPAGHGVAYLLAVANSGRGTTDALNRRYPTLYDSGGGVASLALDLPNSGLGQPDYRLYRVTG